MAFYIVFSKDMTIRWNGSFLEDWFDEAFADGAFSIFLFGVKAYFIDGGNVQVFCKRNG